MGKYYFKRWLLMTFCLFIIQVSYAQTDSMISVFERKRVDIMRKFSSGGYLNTTLAELSVELMKEATKVGEWASCKDYGILAPAKMHNYCLPIGNFEIELITNKKEVKQIGGKKDDIILYARYDDYQYEMIDFESIFYINDCNYCDTNSIDVNKIFSTSADIKVVSSSGFFSVYNERVIWDKGTLSGKYELIYNDQEIEPVFGGVYENGKKQGRWKELSLPLSFIIIFNNERFTNYYVATGNYKNGIKNDEWVFNSDNDPALWLDSEKYQFRAHYKNGTLQAASAFQKEQYQDDMIAIGDLTFEDGKLVAISIEETYLHDDNIDKYSIRDFLSLIPQMLLNDESGWDILKTEEDTSFFLNARIKLNNGNNEIGKLAIGITSEGLTADKVGVWREETSLGVKLREYNYDSAIK